jgi:hypothetical protein
MALNTIPNPGLTKRGFPTARVANPLVINGDMAVSQRGTSFTSNGYSLDRYTIDESTDGAITVTQDTDVPSGYGFGKSLKVDCTTADASIGAAQYCIFTSKLEGQNLQLLKYGTSSAENVTLSFWVKSVKTGTYCMSFVKEAGSGTRYECPIEYTISSASTWEKKVINLSPTAGSTSLITAANGAIVNSNASGFRIIWTLVSGSNFHATNNTWVAGSDKLATSNQVNFLDSTSNNFWITGVQLNVGEFNSTTLPAFAFESFGDNLERCLRYYYRANGRCGFGAGTGFVQDGAVKGYIYHTMPVPPRTEMSFSLSDTSGGIITIDGNASDTVTSISATHSDSFPYKDYEFNFVTNGSSVTDKCGMGVRINASNYIEGSAEL